MAKLTFQIVGKRLADKRGERGTREIAKEIGISAATLSRVERRHVPDLETFGKVCKWLKIDPGEVLGVKPKSIPVPKASVHFKKDRELKAPTAEALAQMILAAQRALMAAEASEE